MSGVILAASTDQYAQVKLWTVADGLPKTDVTHATSGLSIKYQIGNAAVQSVTVAGSPAPASMSAGGAHADWGIYHIGNGWYKIGLADAVLATAGNRVRVWIELTDCDSAPAEIYVSGYDGSAVAVGANTTTPPTTAAIATAVDAALLDAGDATDLIASIVTRIGNTNVDETAFVSALKAALFDAGSVANKLVVNASGQVETSNATALDAAGVRSAVGLATANLDTQLSGIDSGLGNVPSTTEISDRIERVGGPLDLLETLALTGPNTVTVTVTDSVSLGAIQSAKVKVFRTGETESKLTNASGVTTHGLTSNTFVFTTNARGYASDVQTVVVTGDQSVDVSMTPVTISDPGTPGVCRLIAYVYLGSTPVQGATVTAKLRRNNQATDGVVQSVIPIEATTNANGLATLDLVRGGQFVDGDGVYLLEARHQNKLIWSIESAMPDDTQANLEDLLTP